MLCSGCGKDIPFSGTVCPYCHRDKSKDQGYTVVAFIFGGIGGMLGYLILGFWGFIVGMFFGIIIAAVVAQVGRNTKPPEVQVVSQSAPLRQFDDSVAGKIVQLKQLHNQGLLTTEEFSSKKREILAKF